MKEEEIEQSLQQAREVYQHLRSQMRARWQRDLPVEELIFDRWERAQSLGFEDGANIYHNSYVYGDVTVGEKTWIGPYTLLDGTGGLSIGDYCNISAGVQIYTHDTIDWVLSRGKAKYAYAPVKIGDCCHVGSQTVIVKGVTIGDHCVVGACSFVNRDIPPYTVAFGVPCRPFGQVAIDEEGSVSITRLNV